MLTSIPDGRGCYTDFGVSGYGMVVALTRKALMNQDLVRNMAEEMMMSIAHKCLDLGARALGHVKSFIHTDSGSVRADTIGIRHGVYSTGQMTYSVKVLYMSVSVVVLGIPEGAVKAATLEGLYQVADCYSLAVDIKREHAYFNEFDIRVVQREIETPFLEFDMNMDA